MISWDAEQISIANSPYKRGTWLFQVTTAEGREYCWSTKAKLWDGKEYRPKVLPESFAGVRLSMSGGRMRMVAPNEVIFRVANADADDYRGATVLISALLSDGTTERVMSAFKMRVKGSPKSVMGCRQFVCEDFLQQYLRGAYPNTRNPYDLFPSIDAAGGLDAVCVPKIWGTAYIPLRPVLVPNALTLTGTTISFVASSSGANCKIQDSGNGLDIFEVGRNITISGSTSNNISATVLSVSAGELELPIDAGITTEAAGDTVTIVQSTRYYLLGPTGPTYSPTQIHSPGELGLMDTWDSTGYTFAQTTITDGESNDWKGLRPVVVDIDNDGTADDAIFWRPAGRFLDMPTKYSKSDTASRTGPEDVIADVWEDLGVAAADIDTAGTFADAGAVFAGWGLEWNGGIYYQQSREEVISMLHAMCHSCLQVTDKLELHVLSKTSVATFSRTNVIRRSWRPDGSVQQRNRPGHEPTYKEDVADAAYVAWMETGRPQDRLLQTLVGVKGSRTQYSDEVLRLPFVQNSVHVRKLGRLFWQREFLVDGRVTPFTVGAEYMKIRPEDIASINESIFGGSFDFRVDDVFIAADFSVEISGSTFSDTLEDWGDIFYDSITVYDDSAVSSKYFTPALGGPLADKNVATAGFDVYGLPYLVVGPNTNRAKYTDIQSALNALIESRHGGIFILDGVYTLPTTYLPDRDISVMGESMGGVELRNTANEQLFVLFDLTSNFNFSNFFVNSQNDGNTSDPLFRINGTTAASNTSRVFIEKVKFALKDTSTWAQTTGDCGIYCNRGQGSIVINNSYCEGGSYFVSINEYEIFRMSQCQTEDIMYADVNAVDLNDVEVAGLVSKNFRFRCLRFYNSDIKKRCIIQAVNAVSKSNLIGSKYQQGALVRYYDLVNIISSIFEIANGCSGAGQTAGIDTYNCNQLLVDKNIISINITDTYQTRGIGLFNINNGNVEGNNLRIDNTNIGQNHYGIFGQNLDDSVVNGNNVNMVNSGAKDVGYSWDATSTGNRGAGNLALNFGTAEIDLGGNSIDVNGA